MYSAAGCISGTLVSVKAVFGDDKVSLTVNHETPTPEVKPLAIDQALKINAEREVGTLEVHHSVDHDGVETTTHSDGFENLETVVTNGVTFIYNLVLRDKNQETHVIGCAPETKVLMRDYSVKTVSELESGDQLLSTMLDQKIPVMPLRGREVYNPVLTGYLVVVDSLNNPLMHIGK